MNNPIVELIYDRDCPNIGMARMQIIEAFTSLNLPPVWTEWEKSEDGSPAYVQLYGSPTVLVDQLDVAMMPGSDPISCCRLYTDKNGAFQGAPGVDRIKNALAGSRNQAKQ